MDFVKSQGCGNDYVFVNCFSETVKNPQAVARYVSDRHFGVGSDGLILIKPSGTADFRMEMYNADGSEGEMCGNGIRCVAKYLYDAGYARKDVLRIETLSGVKTCTVHAENGEAKRITVDMGRAELRPEKIPVALPGEQIVGQRVAVAGSEYTVTCVSMGNPHCVVFGGDPDGLDLPAIGPKFENDPLFPDRVNTEFVQVIDGHTLKMRVWERGSGETMACGTGTCATVAAAVLNGICAAGEDVTVRLRGGELTVNYMPERILMTGEAVRVFEGWVEA